MKSQKVIWGQGRDKQWGPGQLCGSADSALHTSRGTCPSLCSSPKAPARGPLTEGTSCLEVSENQQNPVASLIRQALSFLGPWILASTLPSHLQGGKRLGPGQAGRDSGVPRACPSLLLLPTGLPPCLSQTCQPRLPPSGCGKSPSLFTLASVDQDPNTRKRPLAAPHRNGKFYHRTA